ncbi:NUDIX hydrolase [Gottfriedia acidiceleris]|uniref:NUDIX hydrolase n=1 Tax=Gottfriedia acidiceleris TaxID=371036 RepID=UPI002FFF27D8
MNSIGGTMKYGEILDNALIREFYEELGVKVDIKRSSSHIDVCCQYSCYHMEGVL